MPDDIETVAKQRVQARNGFVTHALMYLVMNTGFVIIWRLTGSGYPWFMWPALGWGVGLFAHAVTLWLGPGSSHERRAIERELARMRTTSR